MQAKDTEVIKIENGEANVLDVCVTRTMPTSVMQRQILMVFLLFD